MKQTIFVSLCELYIFLKFYVNQTDCTVQRMQSVQFRTNFTQYFITLYNTFMTTVILTLEELFIICKRKMFRIALFLYNKISSNQTQLILSSSIIFFTLKNNTYCTLNWLNFNPFYDITQDKNVYYTQWQHYEIQYMDIVCQIQYYVPLKEQKYNKRRWC